MASQHLIRRFLTLFAAAAISAMGASLLADDSGNAKPSNSLASSAVSSNASDAASGTDLFAAMKSGDVDVKIIPRDSRRAQVILKNNTDQPLTVKLPEAFVATPVLAQVGGAGGNNNNRNTNNNNNNKNQSVGGGMGGMGGGGGGGFGGAFSIPPERVVKMQVAVVCLEFGKTEPSAHVPYTIEPAEKYTSDPEVQQICRLLGEGKLDQRAAQAAAWHVANHMSWDDLANLKIFPHFPQYTHPYFSDDELHGAMAIVDQAIKAVDAAKNTGGSTATAASGVSVAGASATAAATRN